VGWQDRDWAKWTDEERGRYLGGGGSSIVPGAFIAVAVSLVAFVAFGEIHGLRTLRIPTRAASVYGDGLMRSSNGAAITCTAMVKDVSGVPQCTVWTTIFPGQQPETATPLPPGTTCDAIKVDQQEGRWVCAAPTS
jgi:hypothetical protein